ncbi:hypothetical protein JHS3_31600 [Jeongeupia sp. HS-3]|uniref:rhodanese-like domain-containing protein n=1 Tax=Jeongeupia sp. HS-3 TaxID=1009682 RepID=UPI0018A51592|nr:rhodanese-like domain-containing protein [Jeongeupia sp. HS-3]BCL77424.1 hypothetical protein JHS3_31600 [Jeongeupia sp. HS-3]
MSNAVTAVPAAASAAALAHFTARLGLETDCADVFANLQRPDPGFVLLDVRSKAAFMAGHVPGALSLPHHEINAERMAA